MFPFNRLYSKKFKRMWIKRQFSNWFIMWKLWCVKHSLAASPVWWTTGPIKCSSPINQCCPTIIIPVRGKEKVNPHMPFQYWKFDPPILTPWRAELENQISQLKIKCQRYLYFRQSTMKVSDKSKITGKCLGFVLLTLPPEVSLSLGILLFHYVQLFCQFPTLILLLDFKDAQVGAEVTDLS